MLLTGLGLMFGSYLGYRLFEKRTYKKKYISQKTNRDEEYEKKCNHFLKFSTLGMGLSILNLSNPSFTLFSTGILIYSSIPILKRGEKSLLNNKKVNNDVISAIVTLMTFILTKNIACCIQVFSYHFGHSLILKNKNQSIDKLKDIFTQQPHKVWVLKENAENEIPLEEVKKNDIIVVKAGEIIQIDGIIIEGLAVIDQQTLTGESVPVERSSGDKVYSSTIILRGKLHIRVEKSGAETTAGQLSEILNKTTDFKMSLQLKGEKLVNQSAKPLLGISVVSVPILGASSATAILFSAPLNTTQALTSLHTWNHLNLMSDMGVLIKDGRALEALAEIDTVIFDKTGTLTYRQLEIGKIIHDEEFTENEILAFAAIAEQRLEHPIAHVIREEAEKRNLILSESDNVDYKIGYGVKIQLYNLVIKVGSIRFMKLEGIALPSEIEEAGQESQEKGYSLVLVAVNNRFKGAIEVQAKVRLEAKEVIKNLCQRGIKNISIVSGDYKGPTRKLAQELGVDNYYYETLPQDKAKLVEKLQKEGRRVCFIGDGINDIIAMKKADVSISLQGASDVTKDMAQIVLIDGNLLYLDSLIEISNNLNAKLKHTLWYWGSFGAINILVSSLLGGGITLSVGFFSVAVALGSLHAMYPLKQPEKGLKKQKWSI